MNQNSRTYCGLSQREIADELKQKETNASRSIKKLKEKNYIEIKDKKSILPFLKNYAPNKPLSVYFTKLVSFTPFALLVA